MERILAWGYGRDFIEKSRRIKSGDVKELQKKNFLHQLPQWERIERVKRWDVERLNYI